MSTASFSRKPVFRVCLGVRLADPKVDEIEEVSRIKTEMEAQRDEVGQPNTSRHTLVPT